jgi:hypothetical protein
MYQQYVTTLGLPDILRAILDRVHAHIVGSTMDVCEVDMALSQCESIQLGEDDCGNTFWNAVDAINATSALLQASKEYCTDNVVHTAELVRNVLDRPLWKMLSKDYPLGVTASDNDEIHESIIAHSSMAREIEREFAQVNYLLACNELDESSVSSILRL